MPGCHGDGDPTVIGPTMVQLFPCFVREDVETELVHKVRLLLGGTIIRASSLFSTLCSICRSPMSWGNNSG